jgi:hypothetical protein
MSKNYIAVIKGTTITIKDTSTGSDIATWNAGTHLGGTPTQALVQGDEVHVHYSNGKVGIFTIRGSGKRYI